jgi:hypothetical protein
VFERGALYLIFDALAESRGDFLPYFDIDSTSGPVSMVQLWNDRDVFPLTRLADFICSAHSRSCVVMTNCVSGKCVFSSLQN